MVAWIEDGWQHRLYFTDAVSTEDALAVAESLVVLEIDDWRAAVLHPARCPTTSRTSPG